MNKHSLSNLIALGEGFTTEFKRTGTSNPTLGESSAPLPMQRVASS
jgi:hypothetical protein